MNQRFQRTGSLAKKDKTEETAESDLDQKEKNLQTNQFILSIPFFGSKHKHTLGS